MEKINMIDGSKSIIMAKKLARMKTVNLSNKDEMMRFRNSLDVNRSEFKNLVQHLVDNKCVEFKLHFETLRLLLTDKGREFVRPYCQHDIIMNVGGDN